MLYNEQYMNVGGEAVIFDRYAGEYRLENQSDANRKIKTVAVYHGREYHITVSGETLRSFLRKWCGGLVVNVILFLLGCS